MNTGKNVHGNVIVFGLGGKDLLLCCCGRASNIYEHVAHIK